MIPETSSTLSSIEKTILVPIHSPAGGAQRLKGKMGWRMVLEDSFISGLNGPFAGFKCGPVGDLAHPASGDRPLPHQVFQPAREFFVISNNKSSFSAFIPVLIQLCFVFIDFRRLMSVLNTI